MKILALLGACACVLLGGCYTGIYAMTPEQLETQETIDLASAYGNDRVGLITQPQFESELRRRNAFTAEEWARIEKRDLKPGDSMEFALASWGPPDNGINRDSLSGTRSVWCYYDNYARPGVRGYVHFTGRLVTAIDR